MSARLLTLCDHPISSNALKVRFLLAELGLDYERREIPITRPRPDDYVALNPLAGIPTLIDGELVLTESNAILRYLANRYGGEDLYPADAAERAPVDELLDRYSLTLRPAFFSVEVLALGFTPQGGFGSAPIDPDAAVARAAEVAGHAADVRLDHRSGRVRARPVHDRRLRGRSRALSHDAHRDGPDALPQPAAVAGHRLRPSGLCAGRAGAVAGVD